MQCKWHLCAEHHNSQAFAFMMRIKTPWVTFRNGQNVSKRYIKRANIVWTSQMQPSEWRLSANVCHGQYCIQNMFNVRTYPKLFMPILDALWMHSSNPSLYFTGPFASSCTPRGLLYHFGFFQLFNPSQCLCETVSNTAWLTLTSNFRFGHFF